MGNAFFGAVQPWLMLLLIVALAWAAILVRRKAPGKRLPRGVRALLPVAGAALLILSVLGMEKPTGEPNLPAIDRRLMQAARDGSPQQTAELIKAGANVNARLKDGTTPLVLAVWANDPKVMTVLVNAGADVNAPNVRDQYGIPMTALIYAAERREPEAVAALIQAGADIHAKNEFGETALMRAVSRGKPEAAAVLIKAGADVNAQDNRGNTPLMLAAGNSLEEKDIVLEMITMLVKAGADVNARDELGQTPLMSASKPDVLSALLELGADPKVKDKDGKMAIDYIIDCPGRWEEFKDSGAFRKLEEMSR